MRLIDPAVIVVVTIWQEARNQPHEGRIAVAEIILRRTEHGFRSDGTIVGTCLWPYQFSGWNTKDPNRIPSLKLDTNEPIVADCLKSWNVAQAGSNLTHDADSYFNPKIVTPDWFKGSLVTARIADHVFLRMR